MKTLPPWNPVRIAAMPRGFRCTYCGEEGGTEAELTVRGFQRKLREFERKHNQCAPGARHAAAAEITKSVLDNIRHPQKLTVPDPESRIPRSLWKEVRAWLLANDPDAGRLLDWSASKRELPQNPEEMAYEIIWIILCAGRSAQAARTIEGKVLDALHAGRPVIEAFGHKGKAAAIERAWSERDQDYETLIGLGNVDEERLVTWCKSLPYVGDDTSFQLGKNFGADLCKPDIWLCRLTGIPDKPRRKVELRYRACKALCQHLGEEHGDNLATMDSLLWLACNKGVLRVSADAGPVTFVKEISKESIFK